ncbi:Outer membrane protein (porin) [Variovorax sp. HW608]|uniref:porin n=1 Tax=Variovorax sp. HW608 TaxID=1034889 RepID=UPI00081F7847|nr:porin [Variovorax sp. HW608]SCK10754.1 Outer membrane protein (porin) [Variovorax sp. HW608]
MKKSLVSLAALAVAGVASAQSSVTLFGVVDATVEGYSNKSENIYGQSVKGTKNTLTSSGYNSSRLGFRGTEDLGGGLAASFWLEAGIGNEAGTTGGNVSNTGGVTGLFNRRSTVSLSGAFGEVRLGRDYVPTFWNDTVFDPFGSNGVGASLILTANGFGPGSPTGFTANNMYVRASNSVGYFLPPNLGGFYGQVMYAFNGATKYDNSALTPDIANTQRAGRYIGGRGGYANGPLDVAAAYGEATIADNFFAGTTSVLKSWNIGASYDFGVVKLFGEYSQAKNRTDYSNPLAITNVFAFTDPGAKGWLIGATVPVGPGLIRASYSGVKYSDLPVTTAQLAQINQVFGLKDPKADKFALGYVHNLSKRTALYATVAYVNNKDNSLYSAVGSPGVGLATAGSFYAASGTTANNALAQAAIGATHPTSSLGYDLGIRHAF